MRVIITLIVGLIVCLSVLAIVPQAVKNHPKFIKTLPWLPRKNEIIVDCNTNEELFKFNKTLNEKDPLKFDDITILGNVSPFKIPNGIITNWSGHVVCFNYKSGPRCSDKKYIKYMSCISMIKKDKR